MKNSTRKFLLALALLCAPLLLVAQTTLPTTTLVQAVNGSLPNASTVGTVQSQVTLSSLANINSIVNSPGTAIRTVLWVDRELMAVNTVNSLTATINVQRGYNGTAVSPHNAGATVYVGSPDQFYAFDPAGACASASTKVTPWINYATGNQWTCSGGIWTLSVIFGGSPAVPSGNQGGSVIYDSTGLHLLSIFEPQSSCSFTAASNPLYVDRCAAMHACFTSNVNGVTGDVCDARCELSNPTFTCNSNPFPVSTDAQNAGTMLLPPGQISYTACFNFNPANGGEVWGTADGNGTAGGPTMLYAGGGWSPGSGATWCPGLFSWGQPWPGQWNSSSNGQFGPYSTHGGLFQINCHNQSHIHGLDLLSGQDNTWLGRLSFVNCADALIVAGSRGTQNGTIIDGVFATKSSGLGSIANTPESGGIPWLISSWFIMNSGSAQPGNMVMTVTGGACGSGGNSLCDPFPGEDIFIGADAGLSNSGTCTGTGCLTNPVNGTHGTFFGAQLNGQYTIGAISDFDSVVSYSCVPSNCQGASHTVSITFVMSAPSDFPVDSGGAACVAAYGSPTNCNSNAIGYMSGFTDTHLNNLQVVITQVSGTSVTGWITCAACTGVTSTGGVAYANTIDVAQYAGTTFTAANQFAVHTNLLAGAGCSAASWPGSPSDCWSGTPQISNGTVIVFGNNVVVNNTAGFRPWHQVTLTNTNAFESVFSEYPIQDYTINGWGFGVRDSHLESTVFCGISIGENGPTANVLLENLWVNSNIGFIQTGYCGGAVSGNQTSSCNNVNSTAGYSGIAPAKTCGGSGNLSCGANTGNNHSCAVHIFNRYGSTGCTVTTGTGVPFACGTAGEPVNVHIKQMDMEATGLPGGLGSNVPGFAVVDDGWGNAISNGLGIPGPTACPHLGFYDLDGVGYPSTDCPPGSLNNGASYYNGAIYVVTSGVVTWYSAQQLKVTGSNYTTSATTLATAGVITGLNWTGPTNVAVNTAFGCDIVYSQATAAAANLWGVITAGTAPTNLNVAAEVMTNQTGTQQVSNATGIVTATQTTVVTSTPTAFGAIGTTADMFTAHLWGTAELPANATASQIGIAVATGNASDALTIYRDLSSCHWY
jgi:hypothetical protein